jgi:hypothetical protein
LSWTDEIDERRREAERAEAARVDRLRNARLESLAPITPELRAALPRKMQELALAYWGPKGDFRLESSDAWWRVRSPSQGSSYHYWTLRFVPAGSRFTLSVLGLFRLRLRPIRPFFEVSGLYSREISERGVESLLRRAAAKGPGKWSSD